MYESFFGFRERPFDLTPNPRYLVLTEIHREALSNLEYGIASRKGITLLIGEAGSGKTTLIRTAIAKQPERVHCVHVQNPALTRAEFVEMLAEQFGLSEEARHSKAVLLSELEALLRNRRQAGATTVLIIDEGQSLPLELLEEIRLLANIETDDDKLLSVIIAGQPELSDLLNDRALRQLKQRVALRCELRPLTLQETAAYIAGRIRAAGGVGAQVFTREAVTLLHERSLGIPRTISVIADNALLTGFAEHRRPVTSQMVRDVCRDFDLKAAAPVSEEAMPAPGGPQPGASSVLEIQRPAAADIAQGETAARSAADASRANPSGQVSPEAASAAADDQAPMFGTAQRKRGRFFF